MLRRPAALAQDSTAAASPDARLFAAVYAVEAPAAVAVWRVAEGSSAPLIVGAAPVLGAVALARGEALDPALRAGASQAAAYVVVYALKRSVRRERPFRALPGVEPRGHTRRYLDASASFPSGHAALAFALATSVSLSTGEAWVAVPALAWATATGTTRVWHGVHYPLDVAAGAALGVGAALAVHAFAPEVGRWGGAERAVVVPLVVARW